MGLEIGYGHRHQQHQQLAVFGVLRRNEHSGTAGVGELDENVGGRNGVENLNEVGCAEAYDHFSAGEVAGNNLAGRCAEVVVGGLHSKLILFNLEFHEAVALIDKYAHASHGVEERLTVNGDNIGIFYGNDAVVVGE